VNITLKYADYISRKFHRIVCLTTVSGRTEAGV